MSHSNIPAASLCGKKTHNQVEKEALARCKDSLVHVIRLRNEKVLTDPEPNPNSTTSPPRRFF